MHIADETIRERARARIADIFELAVDDVRPEMRFATDFRVTQASDFKRNEFDRLLEDIRDVANREITNELDSGALVIDTVRDYCNHMVRCYSVKPRDVASVVRLRE